MEALTGNKNNTVPIKPLPPLRFERGNIIVEVDDKDYEKGALQC